MRRCRRKVLDQEARLIQDQLLENRAKVKVEVPGVVALDDASWRPACEGKGSSRWRDRIGFADTEQNGALDLVSRKSGAVSHDLRDHAGSDVVDEFGSLGHQFQVTTQRIVRAHQSQLARVSRDGYSHWCGPLAPGSKVTHCQRKE